jgi:hypothetical protein
MRDVRCSAVLRVALILFGGGSFCQAGVFVGPKGGPEIAAVLVFA